ncbi:MAG: SAM-dependent methyltransferase [Chloroflexota bacterium]|nr:SAM-dependent methyltransferase [Chloroflexota bacterium]
MDSQQTFSRLLDQLGYSSNPYLFSDVTSKDSAQDPLIAELDVTWHEARDKLGIDAIYFVANAPVIYFKRFEAFDREEVARLHCNVWNQGRVPLLFVILPEDIRIYNGYETPRRTTDELDEPSRLDYDLNPPDRRSPDQLWERLEIFTRVAIESGDFWHHYGSYFDKETRVDQKLIENLRYIRRQLITEEPELSPRYAHSLIGRSIFALYLQDRDVLTAGENGFFTRRFGNGYMRYTDLLTSYQVTYNFFELLHQQFNGDMFPVTHEEKEAVRSEHLAKLRTLFTVDSVKGGQALFFWAYNFEFIPIELISAIYEEFLYQEESGKDGTYYTPPMLVDFMLNQALPKSDQNYEIRLLDPACGSGIFLVEAYRRLVERWRSRNKQNPGPAELIELLKKSIFGVDIKLQALQIAAFSLYLAMLDYIEPKTIRRDVQFPPLIGTNLIVADFFEERVNFEGHKFDLVVGNPPWMSNLTSHAEIFRRKHGYKIGDKQIVQAFLWHAPDFCKPNGQIALLCSSKSLLFNKSGPNVSFRLAFFNKFTVTKIFDFSALRHFLFEKGVAPTAAIFYRPGQPSRKARIFYAAPKLTHLTRYFAAIVIETFDLKHLPLWQVLENLEQMRRLNKDDSKIALKQTALFDNEGEEESIDDEAETPAINIWKIALWGSPYDHILLEALAEYPSLLQVIEERKWISRGGFNHKGPGERKQAEWLDNAPYLAPKDFTRYGIDPNTLTFLPKGDLYYRRGIPEQFKAPLVLFKRTQVQRQIAAAYLNHNCTYRDTFTCIAGPAQDNHLLKAVTALLNSEIAQYYLFLSSASWGVEREEIKAGEMKTLPFPFLNADEEQINIIVELVDGLAKRGTTLHETRTELLMIPAQQGLSMDALEKKLNDQIYQCFHLSEQEIQHIKETLQYTIGFFNSPKQSDALKKPDTSMLVSYAEAFINSINFYLESSGRKFIAQVYNEVSSLYMIQFNAVNKDEEVPTIQLKHADNRMREVLTRLPYLATEPVSRKIYHKRSFRLYDKAYDIMYIAKPAERRYWTIGAALNDVGETISTLV